MKRNLYAAVILLILALTLLGCRRYVSETADDLQAQVQQAYAQTLAQQYPKARESYTAAAQSARRASRVLVLLVRRTALERMNETFAVLAEYANPDNQADLAVETARVCAQIEQMKQSFWGGF